VVVLPRDKKQTVHFRQHKFITLSVFWKTACTWWHCCWLPPFIEQGVQWPGKWQFWRSRLFRYIIQNCSVSIKAWSIKDLWLLTRTLPTKKIKIHINSGFKYMKGKSALTEGEKSYNLLKNLIYDLIHNKLRRVIGAFSKSVLSMRQQLVFTPDGCNICW